jgi:hypothetical protein
MKTEPDDATGVGSARLAPREESIYRSIDLSIYFKPL